MARRMTKEERIALKITDLVNDLTLDLDEVGKHLAITQPTVIVNRLVVVAEAALDEKEYVYGESENYIR